MHALPPAPAPAPKRQLFVGTALACAAATMLVGSMLAIWARFRAAAPLKEGRYGLIKDWLPSGVTVPEVPTNIMLITVFVIPVMAQWAVYSVKRADRQHAGLALGVVGIMGLAFVNAQAFVWRQMGMGVAEGAYQSMFYAITGTVVVLFAAGLVFTVVTAFRYLGSRSNDTEMVSSLAMYWYFLAAAYAAVWFLVYVQK
jgi:heme/copper-type cytochrome/quinol oxidase subunit 3